MNADRISGFVRASRKSVHDVDIMSAASNRTINKTKHAEMPLITKKNKLSDRWRRGGWPDEVDESDGMLGR